MASAVTLEYALNTKTALDAGECAEGCARRPGDPCSTNKVLDIVSEFVLKHGPVGGITRGKSDQVLAFETRQDDIILPSRGGGAKVVRDAAEKLNCTSESCVLSHPDFKSFVREQIGADAEKLIEREKEERFKTFGPRNSTKWLDNENIDYTLQRWARVFDDFYPYSFNMIDFESAGGSLARNPMSMILDGLVAVNLGNQKMVTKKCRCAASVVNTDRTGNRGKHWTAVFIDCRKLKGLWTVEFFNSSGNPPAREIVEWMEKTRQMLIDYRRGGGGDVSSGDVDTVVASTVRHQYSESECGVYSLYYIRKRLEKMPLTFFGKHVIPDDAMIEFRKYLFRKYS
mgnify:CR=1 FL=1